MSHYKDWRPEKLDVESIATDAQLTRIEAKLDQLLSLLEGIATGTQTSNSKLMKHYG